LSLIRDHLLTARSPMYFGTNPDTTDWVTWFALAAESGPQLI
jgi:hypothetical protein